MWKRVGLVLLVLAPLAAGVTFWRVARTGQGEVEAWVGTELKDIVNARGTLTLDFRAIDYQYPNRLVLTDLRLDRPGVGTVAKPMFDVRTATIELDEVPRRGRPIAIRSIDLDRPVVHLDEILGRRDATARPATRPALSRVVKLRRVRVRDGRIDYDDASGSPLTWGNLDADLALDPVNEHAHRVTLAIDQPPLMSVHAAGELDLDATSVSEARLSASLDLGDPAATRFFTPAIQRFLTLHEVRGTCRIDGGGSASLRDPAKNAFAATVTLAGGHMTFGQYHVPLDHLDGKASLRGPVAAIDALRVEALGGLAMGDARLALDGQRRITGSLSVTNVRLDQLVREQLAGQSKRLAGVLSGQAALHTSADMLGLFRTPAGGGIVWGDGTLNVRDGRMTQLPIIGDLLAATRRLADPSGDAYRDRLEATFDFVGKRLDCSQITYVGDVIAARGSGSFAFNGDVDLALNAGPLENVQERLGPIGELWGKVTDQLMTYHVTGKLKSPQITTGLGK